MSEIDNILTKWLMEDHTGEDVSVKEMHKVKLYIDKLRTELAAAEKELIIRRSELKESAEKRLALHGNIRNLGDENRELCAANTKLKEALETLKRRLLFTGLSSESEDIQIIEQVLKGETLILARKQHN